MSDSPAVLSLRPHRTTYKASGFSRMHMEMQIDGRLVGFYSTKKETVAALIKRGVEPHEAAAMFEEARGAYLDAMDMIKYA